VRDQSAIRIRPALECTQSSDFVLRARREGTNPRLL
jgi:hypothetical protein